jgi:phosphatidate cytidylyltransferase
VIEHLNGLLAGSVSREVGVSLLGIVALLIVATLVVAILQRAKPQRDWTELKLRIRTWWIMATLFAASLLLSRPAALCFFAFVSFLALKEYLSLIPTRKVDRGVLLWIYVAVPLQYLWIGMRWYGMFIIFIPVYCFLFTPMRMVLIGETSGFLRAAGTLHWGLMTTVFCLSHVAFLLAVPQSMNPHGGGAGLVLYLVFLTQFNDVAQYLSGKTMGKRKALPTVSPGKTVEGLLGGIATTLLLAYLLAPWLTPLNHLESLEAGLIIGLGCFLGDVVMSALKRDLGIKDSGSLLPGHGGILDRIDSLTYTAPLFFHFLWYLYGPVVTRLSD